MLILSRIIYFNLVEKGEGLYSVSIEHKRVLMDNPREREHTMTKKYVILFGSETRNTAKLIKNPRMARIVRGHAIVMISDFTCPHFLSPLSSESEVFAMEATKKPIGIREPITRRLYTGLAKSEDQEKLDPDFSSVA